MGFAREAAAEALAGANHDVEMAVALLTSASSGDSDEQAAAAAAQSPASVNVFDVSSSFRVGAIVCVARHASLARSWFLIGHTSLGDTGAAAAAGEARDG